ncbi:hypothetical protein [Streptacidiphilus sp. EB103A]|uniref:hypothetical protein n=1 Tax=Streptacidiphilus sp. EB103A TaxID=3156275 RepID=UPI0035128EE6
MNTLTHFQQSLDTELRERAALLPAAPAPARRARPPRRVLLAAGTAAAAVAVAVAVPLTTGGGADPAFAVTQRADGTVAIRLFSPSGISGLQAELRRLGIHAVALEATRGCKEKDPVNTAAMQNVIVDRVDRTSPLTIIRPSAIPPDQTLLISVYEVGPADKPAGVAVRLETVRQVPHCIPWTVSAKVGPATAPHPLTQPAAVGSPASK